MLCVQLAGCASIVKGWDEGKSASEKWSNAVTLASGLRVPKPYGDYLILSILKKSHGIALAVTDEEILSATPHWAKTEATFAAPHDGAARAAYRNLRAN